MTNFFSQFQALKLDQVNIAITFTEQNDDGIPQKAMVSVLPKTNVEDTAIRRIPAINLKNVAIEDLDREFFSTLSTPLTKVATLMDTAKEYEQSIKKAEAQAKHKKAIADKNKALSADLKKLIESETFNPVTDHKKAIELAKKVLASKPKDTKAAKVIADYSQYARPSLF